MSSRFHLRVLVVEDEEFVRLAIEQMLTRFGCEVLGEADPERALQRFTEMPSGFDLVTLDFHMPKMTGLVLAHHLRKIRPDIPMILVSAFTGDLAPEHIEAAGIRALVSKPFHARDLAAAIARAIAPGV
jgi:two-component system, NtrC family, sensor kinase